MITFSIILALGPIAVYCIVIGAMHLRRRPKVVSGGRDLGCLGLAMIGLFLVGPAELLFPQAAFNLIGIGVWGVILLLYLFMLLFAILNTKPRLVVFGLEDDSLVVQLDHVLQQLDPSTKWLSHSFDSPLLGIQGVVESAGPSSISQIVATKSEQNLVGWHTLQLALSTNFKFIEIERRPVGQLWISLGAILLGFIGYTLFNHTTLISHEIREMLRI